MARPSGFSVLEEFNICKQTGVEIMGAVDRRFRMIEEGYTVAFYIYTH